MSPAERMSPVDTAWLRMDRPSNRMQIVGVQIFDRPVDFARMKRVVAARLLRYERFRQVVVQEATGAFWRNDRDFDIEAHVHSLALPGGAGKAELQHLAADLYSTPLDPGKPLWEFHLVERYGEGSAVICRIHHCIGDGIALVGVMQSLTDDSPDAPDERPDDWKGPLEPAVEPEEGASKGFFEQAFEPLAEAMTSAVKGAGTLLSGTVDLLLNPAQIGDYAKSSAAITAEVAKLALLPNDSRTRFKGTPGTMKTVAWNEPMPLPEVKAVGKRHGASVNDVLLSCVAGALRAYLEEHDDPTADVEVRAVVPVNLRTGAPDTRLGNRFGLIAVALPVGIANPVPRLLEVHRRMEALKGSYQAPATLGLLGLVGICPKPVQDQILDLLAAKASAVMTNVPGPRAPMYFAGAKIEQQMFWVPQSGDLAMGVSILSYNDQVQFGIVTDKKLVPDPERIVAKFAPEFERLARKG